MVSFFFKKHTLPLKMKRYGMMNLNDSYFSLMVKPIFLTLALKRYGFGKTFIKRMRTLLNNQESCILNVEFTTKFFKLDQVHAKVIQYQLFAFYCSRNSV